MYYFIKNRAGEKIAYTKQNDKLNIKKPVIYQDTASDFFASTLMGILHKTELKEIKAEQKNNNISIGILKEKTHYYFMQIKQTSK